MSSLQLILVEGLPGTGKTTLARRLADEYAPQGKEVTLYLEGDLHPCDLQWIARMTPDEHECALQTLRQHWDQSDRLEPWDAIAGRLDDLSMLEDGHVLTAYTKLAFADVAMWDAIQPFRDAELHDGRIALGAYRQVYLQRWRKFGEREHQSDVTVFECAFFQSHITELLGHHHADDAEIIAFLRELLKPVQHLQPELHYVQTQHYRETIQMAGKSRPGWLNAVISWVETSPYGVEHGLTGLDGALSFFDHRSRIEHSAMTALDIPVKMYER